MQIKWKKYKKVKTWHIYQYLNFVQTLLIYYTKGTSKQVRSTESKEDGASSNGNNVNWHISDDMCPHTMKAEQQWQNHTIQRTQNTEQVHFHSLSLQPATSKGPN